MLLALLPPARPFQPVLGVLNSSSLRILTKTVDRWEAWLQGVFCGFHNTSRYVFNALLFHNVSMHISWHRILPQHIAVRLLHKNLRLYCYLGTSPMLHSSTTCQALLYGKLSSSTCPCMYPCATMFRTVPRYVICSSFFQKMFIYVPLHDTVFL